MKKVDKMMRITVGMNKEKPYGIVISVFGTADAFGYTNPRLIPHYYEIPPADGVFDFDFVADEPRKFIKNGPAIISTKHVFENYPKNIMGIRVHGATNNLERSFFHNVDLTSDITLELVRKY